MRGVATSCSVSVVRLHCSGADGGLQGAWHWIGWTWLLRGEGVCSHWRVGRCRGELVLSIRGELGVR